MFCYRNFHYVCENHTFMKTIFILLIASTLVLGCKKKNPETDPTPPEPVTTIGAFYAGGIVFHLDDDGQHGYVITENNLDTCTWSNGNSSLIFPNSNDYYIQYGFSPTALGAGRVNTDLIVSTLGNNGNYAAKICKDLVLNGYDDWFLPSREEMLLVREYNVFSASPFNETNPAFGYFWTSNETSATSAIAMMLYKWPAQGDGQTTGNKNTTMNFKVRAIRRF